jgi:Domain of unknown function (DUF6916)
MLALQTGSISLRIVLDKLTADDFRPRVGSTYRLHLEAGGAVDVVLSEVREHQGWRGAARDPFSVEFVATEPGPWDPQGIRRFEDPDGQELEIFIVPLGPDEESGGMRYEAVFA